MIRATLTVLAALAGAHPAAAQPARADSGALVTTLGSDTVALERWTRTGSRIEAQAVVRSPRTSVRHFVLDLAADGSMRRFEQRTAEPDASGALRESRVESYERAGDAWLRHVTQGDSTRAYTVQADARALPWVDLVHWPFELVIAQAGRAGGEVPLLTGDRALAFRIAPAAGGDVGITHPMRGTSTARVDAQGRLVSLDAGQTTRKVIVSRVAWVDVDGPARRWVAAERAGRGMGELSGRATPAFQVAGATLALDYGVPTRRGRDIFPAVVPYGQVWRTGANRATHFRTDREIVLGSGASALVVPAGEYTLFSLPAADGGVLIVNRQTGQNGTSYDAARDLGRVPMARTALPEPVESLTIRAEPSGTGGTLRISWDRTEFSVPFTVR